MSSDIKTLFAFPGTGLDTDSDLVTIQTGDSGYRRNVVISDDGNFNVITNTLGNTLKTHTLSTGTNKIVGYVEDKENEAGIFFVNNSNNDHSIVRYNSSDDTFTNILSDRMGSYSDVSVLAIPSSRFINAGIIGNGNDQFLVWADGDFLKMINIAYAIAGSYNSALTEEEISFYKKPFIDNISVLYSYDSGYDGNDVQSKIFQFSLRLKYFDKTYSTLSPVSITDYPDTENMASGRLTEELDNNRIELSYDIQNEPTIVDSVQVLYRIADVGSGVPGSWNIYEENSFSAKGVQSTINFYNDKSIGVVSDQEAVRLYDFVPNKSNHVGIVDSNRVVTDVAEEGFDNVDYSDSDEWDVTLTQTETAISAANDGIFYNESNTVGESGSGYNTTETFSAITDAVSDDYYYMVRCTETDTGVPSNEYHYIPSSFKFAATDTIDEIIVFINATGHPVTADKNGSDLRITITPATPTTIVVTVEVSLLERTPTIRSFKTQAKYKFGIRYGYGGKIGAVQTDEDLLGETYSFGDLTATDTLYSVGLRLDIDHTAPTGATDYQIVSFGSNIDYFEEYIVAYNRNDIEDDASAFTVYLDGGSTVIKRDEMVNRLRSAYNSGGAGTEASPYYGIDYGFDIGVGDIVRFVGYSKSVDGVDDYDFTLFGEDLDFRINSVSSTDIYISSSAIRRIDDIRGTASDTEVLLIQIIRLKDTFSNIAQEVSKVYGIVGGYHDGNTVNPSLDTWQTALYPAIIDLTDDFCDVWKSKQVFMNEVNCSNYGYTTYTQFSFGWMEKLRVSLYYDSYILTLGRNNAVNDSAEAKAYNKIRWGGKFIDDANLNYMTKFEFDDVKDLDDRNGVITVIDQVGDTLRVYQERKKSSLYLKTVSSDDPNGTSTFVFSDDVLSEPRQGDLDYGCTHFTSYAKNVRDGYFFDLINGDVLRDGPGGIHSISEGQYKMHTYFKDKAKAILVYGKDDVDVFGSFDDDLDMYILAFIVPGDTSDDVNDIVAFHEPSNRWFTHFSTPTNVIEYFGRLTGKTMVSFLGGQLYLHNDNSTRNNFWGEQFNSEVWIHANEAPDQNKLYDSIEINSIGQWYCPDNDSIEINRPSLMQSRLIANKFKLQEGIYRSEFLRNALNGVAAFVRNLLFNGKRLRGREMTVKLRNVDTSEAQLETVSVKSTISK